jgi:hypothetical protein
MCDNLDRSPVLNLPIARPQIGIIVIYEQIMILSRKRYSHLAVGRCVTTDKELNAERKRGDPLLDVSGGSAQSKANTVEAQTPHRTLLLSVPLTLLPTDHIARMPPLLITADEINCLIYAYLQDSGKHDQMCNLVALLLNVSY